MQTFDSKYRYILVAARRARQLQAGAPSLIATQSAKPQRIALDEIAAGKVDYTISPPAKGRPEAVRAGEVLDRALGRH